jgi:hypothetical protein
VADTKGNFFAVPRPVFEVFRELADESALGLQAATRHGAVWMNQMMEISLAARCKETLAARNAGTNKPPTFNSATSQVRGNDGRLYTVPGELISAFMFNLGFSGIIDGARIKYGASWPSYL